MIAPKCDKCGKELSAYGALVFSPPQTLPDHSAGRTVDKLHICTDCWVLLLAWLNVPPSQEAFTPEQLEALEAFLEATRRVVPEIPMERLLAYVLRNNSRSSQQA